MTPWHRREIHDAMVRFADGDREAFRAVFDGLWSVLVSFTRGMQLDEAEAEDAAQRALLKVFARIADLDRTRDGVTWAVTLAAYEVLTSRKQRTRRRETPVDAVGDVSDGATGPEERAIAEELRRALHAAIGELDARDRAALAEVLEDAGLTPGETARKRRYRALERLRAVWRRAYG
jgi:RNA polymerase sigma factor (sigma-70 family)